MNIKSVIFIFALQIIGKVIYFKRHELYGEIIKTVYCFDFSCVKMYVALRYCDGYSMGAFGSSIMFVSKVFKGSTIIGLAVKLLLYTISACSMLSNV